MLRNSQNNTEELSDFILSMITRAIKRKIKVNVPENVAEKARYHLNDLLSPEEQNEPDPFETLSEGVSAVKQLIISNAGKKYQLDEEMKRILGAAMDSVSPNYDFNAIEDKNQDETKEKANKKEGDNIDDFFNNLSSEQKEMIKKSFLLIVVTIASLLLISVMPKLKIGDLKDKIDKLNINGIESSVLKFVAGLAVSFLGFYLKNATAKAANNTMNATKGWFSNVANNVKGIFRNVRDFFSTPKSANTTPTASKKDEAAESKPSSTATCTEEMKNANAEREPTVTQDEQKTEKSGLKKATASKQTSVFNKLAGGISKVASTLFSTAPERSETQSLNQDQPARESAPQPSSR